MLAQIAALILTLLTGYWHVSGAFHSVIWGWAIADVGLGLSESLEDCGLPIVRYTNSGVGDVNDENLNVGTAPLYSSNEADPTAMMPSLLSDCRMRPRSRRPTRS